MFGPGFASAGSSSAELLPLCLRAEICSVTSCAFRYELRASMSSCLLSSPPAPAFYDSLLSRCSALLNGFGRLLRSPWLAAPADSTEFTPQIRPDLIPRFGRVRSPDSAELCRSLALSASQLAVPLRSIRCSSCTTVLLHSSAAAAVQHRPRPLHLPTRPPAGPRNPPSGVAATPRPPLRSRWTAGQRRPPRRTG